MRDFNIQTNHGPTRIRAEYARERNGKVCFYVNKRIVAEFKVYDYWVDETSQVIVPSQTPQANPLFKGSNWEWEWELTPS